jgi:hypothetical protein
MTSSPFLEHSVALAWGLWSELGVSGWGHTHRACFVDPEPAILWVAWLGDRDARLRDEVTDWCVRFGSWISGSRLANLLAKADSETTARFGALAATVAAHSSIRWRGSTEPRAFEPTGRSRVDGFRAPSQVSLRLRGVFGVGARAEIMRVLLSTDDALAAADLADEIGFGKRIVSLTLDELRQSGVLREHRVRNRLHYRLHDRTAWSSVLGAMPAVWPRWSGILPLLVTTFQGVEHARKLSPRARRVETHKLDDMVTQSAYAAGIHPAPENRASTERLDELEGWLVGTVHDLARGAFEVAPRAHPA